MVVAVDRSHRADVRRELDPEAVGGGVGLHEGVDVSGEDMDLIRQLVVELTDENGCFRRFLGTGRDKEKGGEKVFCFHMVCVFAFVTAVPG